MARSKASSCGSRRLGKVESRVERNSDGEDILAAMRQSLLVGLIALVLLPSARLSAQVRAPTTQRSGPSAASLATPYSGPVKFDRRVLANERAAARDPNPITRGATWRYHYSAPSYYYGGGYYRGNCGYRPYRYGGFFGFTGGATGVGMWGPY
jgi:hypothetical protein